jgi:hypothetical protein
MTKIGIVKEALKKVRHLLKGNDVSCILFNNTYEILTTLENKNNFHIQSSLTVDEIIEKVSSLHCSGCTDFNQIKIALQKLSECDSEQNKRLSVVLSDGYHTNFIADNENISEELENTFDYSVGIGNHDSDFDKELLKSVAKQFTFGSNEYIIIDLLQNILIEPTVVSQKDVSVIIPPCISFISFLHTNAYVLTHLDDALPEETKIPIRHGNNYRTVILGSSEKETEKPKDKMHFIFTVDVSASMEESLNNNISGLQLTYGSNSSNLEPKKIFFSNENIYTILNFRPDIRPLIIFTEESTEHIFTLQDDKLTLITFESQEDHNKEMEDLVVSILEFEALKDYHFDDKMYNNFLANMFYEASLSYNAESEYFGVWFKVLQEFVNKSLTPVERKFYKLFYSSPTMITTVNTTDEEIDNEAHLCIVCCKNQRNTLFKCMHVTMCSMCAQTLTNNSTLKCIVCRANTTWLKQCRFIHQNLRCITSDCQKKVSVMFSPCNHVVYCQTCFQSSNIIHCVCGRFIESHFNVIFP